VKNIYIRHKVKEGEIHNLSDKESSVLIAGGDIRLEENLKVIAPNGNFLSQVVFIDKATIEIEILKKVGGLNDTGSITLIQSVIKENRFKYLVEKSVELGVHEIMPITSSYTSRTVANSRRAHNTWNRYVNDARMQSLRQDKVDLHQCEALADVDLSDHSNYLKIAFTTENIERKDFSKTIDRIYGENSNILIAVGPEKGWSAEDIVILEKFGFEFMTLGDTVLRAETVAPLVIGIINFYIRLK
jgi:16S rRNA (uracil1498-N3)-methyltransferase